MTWLGITLSGLSGVIRKCLDEMTERVDGDGGAIAIDPKGKKWLSNALLCLKPTISNTFLVLEGKVYKDWNSKRMAWAYAIVNDKSSTKFSVHFGCNRDEDFVEEIAIPWLKHLKLFLSHYIRRHHQKSE